MIDYQKPYTTLFNAATDALAELERLNIGKASDVLRAAQQRAEELYIAQDEEKD